MTEGQWLRCEDWGVMVLHVCDQGKANRTQAGRRKLRLFACACARRIWHLLPVKVSQEAVLFAERYADGQGSERERNKLRSQAGAVMRKLARSWEGSVSNPAESAAFNESCTLRDFLQHEIAVFRGISRVGGFLGGFAEPPKRAIIARTPHFLGGFRRSSVRKSRKVQMRGLLLKAPQRRRGGHFVRRQSEG